MEFEFRKMRDGEAREISGWRYAPPYSFYDADQDPEDLEELLDAEKRGDSYYSVTDERGELVGFFSYELDDAGEALTIGLGLRPDLTGRGLGRRFLLAGLDFGQQAFSVDAFRLSVATFNERAIKVYEGAGFVRGRTYQHETNGGVYEFLAMERRA